MQGSHLGLELSSYSILLVCLDDDMKIVQVVDDKRFLIIHHQKDLFHCGVAAWVTG